MSGIKSLDLDNPFSREEDEDVEEQKRREAELQDLLATGFQDFNYDDTTMESSSTSFDATHAKPLEKESTITNLTNQPKSPIAAGDSFEIRYKHADADQLEQLKVLYEIRKREATKLQEQLSILQTEKTKEINSIRSKMLLMEGELKQLQVSNANLGSLLEQKTETLKKQAEEIASKDTEIKKFQQHIAELNLVIGSYETTVNELQMKLIDNNPFAAGDRADNAKQIQKNYEEQYLKMESLIQDQATKLDSLHKENVKLKEEISKLATSKKKCEEENNYALMSLAKKLQYSQEQCKNLFTLGEAVKKESDHFRERLRQIENDEGSSLHDSFNKRSVDKATLMRQIEKLKRLLYDQTIETNSLQAKLKSYDADCNELFQYRKVLHETTNTDIQPCSNIDHADLFAFMRSRLQSYEQAIEDRNQQIVSLNSLNKELREKIEEMIAQARHDIENLSKRYSLPQLETMSKELKNAEKTIHDLKEQLSRKKSNKELVQKLRELQEENVLLKRDVKNLTANFEQQLSEIQQDLNHSKAELMKLHGLVERSQKVQFDLEKENANLAMKLRELNLRLETESQTVDLPRLVDMIQKINNCTQTPQHEEILSFCITHLNRLKRDTFGDDTNDVNETNKIERAKEHFKHQIDILLKELKEANGIIGDLNGKHRTLLQAADQNAEVIGILKEKIRELSEQLSEVDELKRTSPESKSPEVQKNYFTGETEREEKCERAFKNLDEAIDKLQKEKREHEKKVEELYKKALKKKSDHFEKERDKWQQQEAGYRENLAKVLQECGTQIKKLEVENDKLIIYNRQISTEFQTFKNQVQNHGNIILRSTHNQMIANRKWSDLMLSCSSSLTSLDQQYQLKFERLFKKISMKDNEIKMIEQMYREKVKNFQKVYKNLPKF